jgi:hypothetical protein
MKNRQDSPRLFGINEFVAMPGSCCWSGLGLTVTDNTGNNQVRIIHDCTKGNRESISQFATFVDRSGNLSVDGAWEAGWSTELRDQGLHTVGVARVFGIVFGKRPFNPQIGKNGGRSMARSHYIEHVQIVFDDEAVEMRVHQGQAGACSPVPQKTGLDMVEREFVAHLDIILQENHG